MVIGSGLTLTTWLFSSEHSDLSWQKQSLRAGLPIDFCYDSVQFGM